MWNVYTNKLNDKHNIHKFFVRLQVFLMELEMHGYWHLVKKVVKSCITKISKLGQLKLLAHTLVIFSNCRSS